MMRRFFVLLLVLTGAGVWGFTVDEIKELQRMGFSNDQIVDLARGKMEAVPSVVASESVISGYAAMAERLQALKEQNRGLLLVCATKEFPARGPGYLDVRLKYPTGKWGGIGRAMILEYFMNGKISPPVFEHIESDDPCDTSVTITHQSPIIISRYLGEFTVDAGQFEFEVCRSFRMGENENSRGGKMKRHKKFFNVPIKPGMVTILSYYWNENQRFGLDHVMTSDHRSFVERIAEPYGNLVAEIKIQHNN